MDKLFLIRPGFLDSAYDAGGQLYYCPDSAEIEGFLAYFPELRDSLEIRYIDFTKPRREIVEMLGDENQGCPLLIIDKHNSVPETLPAKTFSGHRFFNRVEYIAQYLSLKFKKPLPHT